MRADPDAPADTSMMRIVHAALRRDLQRALTSLTRVPAPDGRQRAAISAHLKWMMAFLEAHHRAEDVGLYALVRERQPAAGALLDDMAHDHGRVAAVIADVDAAAGAYSARDERDGLVVALERLIDALLPHLQREEDEVMPVVSSAITNADWDAIEQQHNLEGKSVAQLGREGHWLIDDASAHDRERVLGLVGPVSRVLLLYGFGLSYRRRRRACWQTRHVQLQGSTAVVVAAGIEAVWDIVRDPTRVGEWSHECVDGAWVGGATAAHPGARFRGRNKQGLVRWGRVCEVVTVEPHELVWRTVPTLLYPDSTEWTIRLAAVSGGTAIEQTFRVVKSTKLEPLYARVVPAHCDRTNALKADLERIGRLAVRQTDAARDVTQPVR